MKAIIPIKLIVEINKDGTYKSGLLQYQIKDNDNLDTKFHTMSVDAGIVVSDLEKIIADSKNYIVAGEKIDEINQTEITLQNDLAELAALRVSQAQPMKGDLK